MPACWTSTNLPGSQLSGILDEAVSRSFWACSITDTVKSEKGPLCQLAIGHAGKGSRECNIADKRHDSGNLKCEVGSFQKIVGNTELISKSSGCALLEVFI